MKPKLATELRDLVSAALDKYLPKEDGEQLAYAHLDELYAMVPDEPEKPGIRSYRAAFIPPGAIEIHYGSPAGPIGCWNVFVPHGSVAWREFSDNCGLTWQRESQ